MKTYFLDIIPKIQRYSKKLDDFTLLTKQNWVGVNEEEDKHTKNTYIFRSNQELIVSRKGKVQKWKWEDLGHNTLLIDKKKDSYLFRPEYLDYNEKIISLRVDGTNEFAFIVEEEEYNNNELWSQELIIDYLEKTSKPMIKDEDEDPRMKRKYDIFWMNNIDLCPACGQSGVKKLKKCPDCKLHFNDFKLE